MKTEICRISEIMETLLAHQPIIDVPYEKINDIAIALAKEGYGNIKEYETQITNLKADFDSLQESYEFVRDCDAEHCLEINETVKQAKIDILNELKTHSYYDDYYMEGYVFVSNIDDLIEEVQNGEDKC